MILRLESKIEPSVAKTQKFGGKDTCTIKKIYWPGGHCTYFDEGHKYGGKNIYWEWGTPHIF